MQLEKVCVKPLNSKQALRFAYMHHIIHIYIYIYLLQFYLYYKHIFIYKKKIFLLSEGVLCFVYFQDCLLHFLTILKHSKSYAILIEFSPVFCIETFIIMFLLLLSKQSISSCAT